MRDYDPTTGRYMQADPLGLVDGASIYGYARQNPGRFVDPTGLCPVCIPIIGVLIGGGTTGGVGGGTIVAGTAVATIGILGMTTGGLNEGENAQSDALADSGEVCGSAVTEQQCDEEYEERNDACRRMMARTDQDRRDRRACWEASVEAYAQCRRKIE